MICATASSCVVRLVRGDDHVREGDEPGQGVVVDALQGLVEEEEPGLRLVHIESDAGEAARPQFGDQSGAVDQSAAAGVDQDRVVLHQGQGVLADDATGRGQQRDMEADQIGLGEELFLLDVRHAELDAGRVLDHVPAEQLHPEAMSDTGEGLADLARTDHADRTAVHVPAEEAVEAEVEVAGAARGSDDPSVDRHGERPGEFGDRVRRVEGDPGDPQRKAFGDVQVDVVEAGGTLGDHLRAARGEGLQHAAAQIGVDAGGDDLVARRDGRGVLVEEDVQATDLVLSGEGLLDQRLLVGLHTECQDFHDFSRQAGVRAG